MLASSPPPPSPDPGPRRPWGPPATKSRPMPRRGSLRADVAEPARLELVEEERARRASLEAQRAQTALVDPEGIVVEAGQGRARHIVEPQLQPAVGGPGTARPLPVELEEVGGVGYVEETGVDARAGVRARARLHAV